MKTFEELLNLQEPGWPIVQGWLREATNPVEVLPSVDANRQSVLVAIQVTTRSPMGAIIYETGGILVDHGWIRLLGSGCERLPRSIADWNSGRTYQGSEERPLYLDIAKQLDGQGGHDDGEQIMQQ
jgi:hypothetical protein